MEKLATPAQLAQELETLLEYAQGSNPSRVRIATELRSLASRLGAKALEPWLEQSLKERDVQREYRKQYRSLADAARITGNPEYDGKAATIWYVKKAIPIEDRRDIIMGYDWLKERRPDLLAEIPEKTHNILGTVGERNLEEIFRMMQGEAWSPMGQARQLVTRKGLDHTSMSVGDVVQIGSQYHFVDRIGFEKL